MPTIIKLPKRKADQKKEVKKNKQKDEKRLIKSVTFFGDSSIAEQDPTYKSVWKTARLLAQNNYSIVNGGGPGVMKAATQGAESVDGETTVVYWEPKLASFFEGKEMANIADESEASSNYLIRTLGLIDKGDAYVVCKGGTGTVSEFGMVWALAKLYYGQHKGVILFGEFWDEIITTIKKNLNIDDLEMEVLYQANTAEEVLELLQKHEQKVKNNIKERQKSSENSFIIGS